MYFTVAILAALFFLVLFSQFGSRLSARHALVWWSVCVFVLTAALWPELFFGLAKILGVSLASNLVFSGLFLLLIFLLVEQGVEITRDHRLLRELATRTATRAFLETAKSQWGAKPGPRVFIVLPTFNEEGSVVGLAKRLRELVDELKSPLDFCFVDDGSTDGTLTALQCQVPGHVAQHDLNMGVAAALLTGMKIAEAREADYVIQCDADGQHPIDYIPLLIEQVQLLKVDLLIGSRYSLNSGLVTETGANSPIEESSTLWRRVGGWCIALALKGFRLPSKITDPTSGFRIYSRRAVKILSRHMPEEYPEPEIIALLSWAGLKIDEIRVPMASRQEGISTIRGFKTLRYMTKVLGALLGLRLRIFFSQSH